MYTNLLITAMDSETIRRAHPAFTEVIRQLSPDEARILRVVQGRTGVPAVIVRMRPKREFVVGESYYDVLRFWSGLARDADCQHPDMESLYTSNLTRLGIFETSENESLNADLYPKIIESEYIKQIIHVAEAKNPDAIAHKKHSLIKVTPFAQSLCDACIGRS